MTFVNFSSFLFLLVCVGLVVCVPDWRIRTIKNPSTPQLWPLPVSCQLSSDDKLYLSQNFQFSSPLTAQEIPLLYGAFERYYPIIFASNSSFKLSQASNLTELMRLDVYVVNPSITQIAFGVNESYSLEISTNNASLTAPTVFGAMHGLETFSQLVRNLQLPEATIHDKPTYPWRGLLVDTSRHYQTLDTLKVAIRGLSYDKMNVLHWHISDGQSFPYDSVKYPKLIEGAYGPDFIYTQSDIKDIISYANQHGVRVVVEFDMPSHAGPAWGVGYPYLTMNCTAIQCHTFSNQYSDACSDFPFDPSNEDVFEFLDGFIEEISSLFVDDYLHLGGDEVKLECWITPHLLEWMANNNYRNFSQVEEYFLSRVQQITAKQQKFIVNWEEVYSSGFTLAPGTIIEVWKDFHTLNAVARDGIGALLAYGWYLDHLDTNWQDFYNNDPNNGFLHPEELANVYGGECCMWAETVDETNFQPKVWPRTSAAAERLWSPGSVQMDQHTEQRLTFHRCRFVNRGINASPIFPGPPCAVYNL